MELYPSYRSDHFFCSCSEPRGLTAEKKKNDESAFRFDLDDLFFFFVGSKSYLIINLPKTVCACLPFDRRQCEESARRKTREDETGRYVHVSHPRSIYSHLIDETREKKLGEG